MAKKKGNVYLSSNGASLNADKARLTFKALTGNASDFAAVFVILLPARFGAVSFFVSGAVFFWAFSFAGCGAVPPLSPQVM